MKGRKGELTLEKIGVIVLVLIVIFISAYFIFNKLGIDFVLKNLPGYTYQEPEDINLEDFQIPESGEFSPKVLVYFDFYKRNGLFEKEKTEGLFEWEEKFASGTHNPEWNLIYPGDVDGLDVIEDNKKSFGKGLVEITDKLQILEAENIRVNIGGEIEFVDNLNDRNRKIFLESILQRYFEALGEGA